MRKNCCKKKSISRGERPISHVFQFSIGKISSIHWIPLISFHPWGVSFFLGFIQSYFQSMIYQLNHFWPKQTCLENWQAKKTTWFIVCVCVTVKDCISNFWVARLFAHKMWAQLRGSFGSKRMKLEKCDIYGFALVFVKTSLIFQLGGKLEGRNCHTFASKKRFGFFSSELVTIIWTHTQKREPVKEIETHVY